MDDYDPEWTANKFGMNIMVIELYYLITIHEMLIIRHRREV